MSKGGVELEMFHCMGTCPVLHRNFSSQTVSVSLLASRVCASHGVIKGVDRLVVTSQSDGLFKGPVSEYELRAFFVDWAL